MGKNPTKTRAIETEVHVELEERWRAWLKEGAPNEEIEELLESYERGEGFEAPKLNEAVEEQLSKVARKKDSFRVEAQKEMGAALMALGGALTHIMQEKNEVDHIYLIKTLSDVGKLITDMFHKQSVSRVTNIVPGFFENARELLRNTTPDEFLFGKNLVLELKESVAPDKLTKS